MKLTGQKQTAIKSPQHDPSIPNFSRTLRRVSMGERKAHEEQQKIQQGRLQVSRLSLVHLLVRQGGRGGEWMETRSPLGVFSQTLAGAAEETAWAEPCSELEGRERFQHEFDIRVAMKKLLGRKY